jgi:putative transposase
VIFADSACEDISGSLMWRSFHRMLNIVSRCSIVSREDSRNGFEPLPKQWVVERTYSWFEAYRRPSQVYEHRSETSKAMVRLGRADLMLRRIP